ncbi:zinc-dependent metalloprotease [Myxococcus stipitatus]|uniref:zinc-dependent metalloprotease n=1 Tax=Myxococcus stipitatus TaxID=83455 RepID=UPI00030164A0|nr:zinc-dependent metalloprotease [Myxococcus stipitatus]
MLAVLWGVLGAGCSGAGPSAEPPGLDLVLGEDLVEVPRGALSAEHAALRSKVGGVGDGERSFYLAIRRSELSQRWFWSATMRHFFPDGAAWGMPRFLRTEVVRMKEYNGRLFFLDARDGRLLGGNEKPDIPLEAYPIVTDYAPFNRLPGSDQYVLFDPASGLGRLGVAGDRWFGGVDFLMEHRFAQRFRRFSQGVMFEEVFAGRLSIPEDRDMYAEYSATRFVGTVVLSLSKYQEGVGYTRTLQPRRPYYFINTGRLVSGTGERQREVVKWNIHRGMQPIRWYVTRNLLELKKDPRYQDLDLVGAIERGIESWNEAFGFPVFEAVLADASMDFGESDKNFAVFDPYIENLGAFADMEENPNTGELRRALFVFGAGRLAQADRLFSDDASARAPVAAPAARLPRPRLTWGGPAKEAYCEQEGADDFTSGDLGALTDEDRAAWASLSRKEKMERYVTRLVMHETGHTLGLAHNLAGSLAYDGTPATPRTSSVMDHTHDLDAIHVLRPGPFDVEAVRYLYGLSPDLPTGLFCSEPNRDPAGRSPKCRSRDRFDDPLTRFYTPLMREGIARILRGEGPDPLSDFDLGGPRDFVRGGTEQEQVRAYNLLMEQLRPPLQVPAGQGAAYVARANAMVLEVLGFLYVEELSPYYFPFPNPPPSTPAYTQAVLSDVKGILLDVDGVRDFATRRRMVEMLKAFQTLTAYGVLRDSHAELTARLPQLSGETLLGTLELIERIEVANSPYFR